MEVASETRVLVTGASRGIGAAIASAFEARGCTVGRLSRNGDVAGDVSDRESIGRAVEGFGTIDVLVANAGIAHYLPFAEMPPELIDRLTEVNWLGTAYTVQAALPGMLQRGRGHIVIVSSGAGIRSFPGAAVYGATKAAQRGFGEALRHELKGTGVGVTMVYPGQIRKLAPRPREGAHARLVQARPRGPGRAAGARGGRGRRERQARGLPPPEREAAAHRPRPAPQPGRRDAAPDDGQERRPVKLPISPPLQPQLAKTGRELPAGDDWRFEPKWDGFRTIVFRDGDEVYLQSRNGKPMNRYFPDIVEQALEMKADRWVIDGEMVVTVDDVQEFDLLSQRIHPAASRVERLAEETPATFVAFDLLAEGDDTLLELPYSERRDRLAALVTDPVELTPSTDDPDAAGQWLAGTGEGVIAKSASAAYKPGERVGMVKIKRVRTADAVVAAFRFGKEPDTVGSLILGLYDEDGKLHIVGHTSSFRAKQKRELLDLLEPYRTGESGSGGPSRWKSEEELKWEGLRPELVCEVSFDHITGDRIRHGSKFLRWRTDKEPRECLLAQLRD